MEETNQNKGLIITGTLVVLVVLFFIFCFRTVGVGQVGIITQFGNVKRESTSGVVIKAPWPIQHLNKMNIKTQVDQQDATAATKDLQNVTTTLALNYHLTPKDARHMFVEVGGDRVYQAVIINPIIQEAVKSTTARYTAEELITQRPSVEQALRTRLTDKLTARSITVDNVSIVNFGFSAEFNAAIEAVQVANQNVSKARQELETTKVEAEKQIAAAQGAAEAQRAQQQTLTPELLQKYAIDKWNGVLPTTNAGANTIFNIPLK